jgi:hypothetical protein
LSDEKDSIIKFKKSLGEEKTRVKYSKKVEYFTRERKLNFQKICVLIVQKTVKSLQIKLNEFSERVGGRSVTASGYSQARAKFRHEFFRDQNIELYGQEYYKDGEYKKYKGYRLIGIDGSMVRLPESKEIRKEYGSTLIKNQRIESEYCCGLSSIAYDVLNNIIISADLKDSLSSERELAKEHFKYIGDKDIFILDRGYPGYEFFKEIINKKGDFICRCSKNANSIVEEFGLSEEEDKEYELSMEQGQQKRLQAQGLSTPSLQVRLIKIKLKTGETEILITSLRDRARFSRQDFKSLYNLRWRVETVFDTIKNRLCLENFTGKSVEAVKQDFYSTILLTNFETELTTEANLSLSNKDDTAYQYKVNKAVSFNAIKNFAFDLFLNSTLSDKELRAKLTEIFLTTPVPIRENRSLPRDKNTVRSSLNFSKYLKKTTF